MDPMGFVIVFGLAFFAIARLTGKAMRLYRLKYRTNVYKCDVKHRLLVERWITNMVKSTNGYGSSHLVSMRLCQVSSNGLSTFYTWPVRGHTTYDDHVATWNGELTNYLIRLATHVEEMAGSDYCQPGGEICVTKNVDAVGKSMNMEFMYTWVLENVENRKT